MNDIVDEVDVFEATPLMDAVTIYAGLLGYDINNTDLTAGLPMAGADLTLDLLPRAVNRLGLSGRVKYLKKIGKQAFPVCARLLDGSYIVILRIENTEYVLADTQIVNGESRLCGDKFEELFGGVIVVILPALEDIQRRHVGMIYKSNWFWGRFYDQKKYILDIVIGSFVANVLAVMVSLFALQVYDRVIPNQSVETLWVLAIGVGIAIVFEGLLRIARSYLMDVSGKAIELELSAFLFQKLLGMKLSTRPASPGSLVYMVREFGAVREFFTATSVGSAGDIPFVGIFLLLIYAIAGNIVWIIVVAAILIVVPSLLMQQKMSRLSVEMLGGTSAAGKLLTEVCYGHETVKSIRGEGFFQQKWEEIITLTASKTTSQRAIASGLTYWSAGIQQVSYVTAVIAGVYMVFNGEFTIGTIIAVSILSTRTLAPITQLSGAMARWQQVRASLKGLDQIANSEQERNGERQYAKRVVLYGNIIAKGVEFRYHPEASPELSIKSFQVKKGETIILLGANGSGKSTFLKVLSGLYSYHTGSLTIDGLEQRQIDPEDLRKNIGYLPQEVKLFSGTLRENLTMGRMHWSEKNIFDALEFSGLGSFIRSHPKGLDLEITDGGDGISVGQRQSVGIARIHLQNPNIVLLDEPTSSLDQSLENNLILKFEEWLHGRTCIIATHRLPILSLATRVFVLQKGAIVLDGPRDSIVKKLTAANKKVAQ